MAQRVMIIRQSSGIITNDNVEEVQALLDDGWTVLSVTQMGAAGPVGHLGADGIGSHVQFAAVMVLER